MASPVGTVRPSDRTRVRPSPRPKYPSDQLRRSNNGNGTGGLGNALFGTTPTALEIEALRLVVRHGTIERAANASGLGFDAVNKRLIRLRFRKGVRNWTELIWPLVIEPLLDAMRRTA